MARRTASTRSKGCSCYIHPCYRRVLDWFHLFGDFQSAPRMELCLLFLAEHHVRRPLRQHSRDFPHAPPRDWKRPRWNGQQDHGNSRAHHCHGCRFGAIQRCRLHCGWYVRRRFHRYSLLAVRDSRQDEHVKRSVKFRRAPLRARSFPFFSFIWLSLLLVSSSSETSRVFRQHRVYSNTM